MVIIKDYNMPHNCYDCDLHNYHECDLTCESIEEDYCWNGDSREKHCPLREVEAIPKDEYEKRLKADMMAILEEIDLQFNEICFYKNMGEWKTVPEIKAEYKAIIREKINSLKAESEPQESEG